MTTGPLVCIVMPAYKTAASVTLAAKSALDQDYYDIIVCVAAPASDTETLAAARSLKDSRVQVLEQTGKGIADARNLIMRTVLADLYIFLDSDDYLNPGMISTYVRHRLETGEAGLRYGHYSRQLADGGRTREIKAAPFLGRVSKGFKRLALLNFIGPGSAMIDREILERVGYFDTRFNHAEDWHFWLRVVRKYPMFGLDIVAYHYTYGKLSKETPLTRDFFDDGMRVIEDVCESGFLRGMSMMCIRSMAAIYYLRTLRRRRTLAQYLDFRVEDFLSMPPAAMIYWLRKRSIV